MSQRTFSMIGGAVARFTRTDQCGRIAYGENARLVTEGFITITATAQVEETDAVEVTNANGNVCARRRAKRKVTGYSVDIELCGVDPEAINFTTEQPVVENGSGVVAGFDVDTTVNGTGSGFALEVWSEVGEGDACAPSGDAKHGYVLFPFLSGGTVGDFTIQNDAINFTVTGATSKTGHEWGTGPYLVDVDDTGTSVALSTVSGDKALRVVEVGLNPPAETDGSIPLDDPDAPSSTGATAGTPGVFTPADSYRPEDLAELQAGSVTATPATAWTTGQYVVLQDGSYAHWDGTAWVSGIAS